MMVRYSDIPEHLKGYFKPATGGDIRGVRNLHPT